MTKRVVRFSSLIQLIKIRRPFSVQGIVFVFSSLFILLPSVVFMSNSFLESYQKYDFEEIEQNGIELDANITDLRSVKNVSMNGEHPLEISYAFVDNGVTRLDKFQTIDLEKTNELKIGSEVKIKAFGNQSKIQDLAPFSFPFYLFYILPLIFFVLGSVFLAIGLIPALRDYNLYKHGVVKEGTIISLTPNSGLPVTSIGQSILVNYYYLGSNGGRLFGKSKSTDFSLLVDYKPEDKIKLYVSEKDESISCLVPLVGV
jgi:hypothetical protein